MDDHTGRRIVLRVGRKSLAALSARKLKGPAGSPVWPGEAIPWIGVTVRSNWMPTQLQANFRHPFRSQRLSLMPIKGLLTASGLIPWISQSDRIGRPRCGIAPFVVRAVPAGRNGSCRYHDDVGRPQVSTLQCAQKTYRCGDRINFPCRSGASIIATGIRRASDCSP
jgi:hypothetical protein